MFITSSVSFKNYSLLRFCVYIAAGKLVLFVSGDHQPKGIRKLLSDDALGEHL